MISKHPLELQPGRKLSHDEVSEALRLAIIAELDAINLYLQLARAIEDEKVRRVFEDIAREEKTHVGEFLALLKQLDPQQVVELERGEREVAELQTVKTNSSEEIERGSNPSFEETVRREVKELVNTARTVLRKIPVVDLGRGVEATVYERLGERLERVVLPLCELSYKFRVSQATLDRAVVTGEKLEIPDAVVNATALASEEEKLVVETLVKEASTKLQMGSWDEPGEAVLDIAKAVEELSKRKVPRPYLLLVNPSRFVKLLVIGAKTGVTDLERIKQLVDDVQVTPHISEDKSLVLSARSEALDVVYGGNAEVDYIGPEDGYHVFRLWSRIAVRVKSPNGLVLLEKR